MLWRKSGDSTANPEMEELKQKPEEELMFKTVPWLKQMALAYLKYGESRYAKDRIKREIELRSKK